MIRSISVSSRDFSSSCFTIKTFISSRWAFSSWINLTIFSLFSRSSPPGSVILSFSTQFPGVLFHFANFDSSRSDVCFCFGATSTTYENAFLQRTSNSVWTRFYRRPRRTESSCIRKMAGIWIGRLFATRPNQFRSSNHAESKFYLYFCSIHSILLVF